jgi:hypothetical protein
MNNKKGRYFLIGNKQTSLSGGAERSSSLRTESGAVEELTKDKAIEMINDELPSEIKDKLLKIFSQIDPNQAKGIAQLGDDEYIKTMIELTSRPIYADDGKVGTELKGYGKEDFVKRGKKQDTIDDEEEEPEPDEEPYDPYDDKTIDSKEYYDIRKEQAEQFGYVNGTDMYKIVNKIIKEDHNDSENLIRTLKESSTKKGGREKTKEFYDIVERIIKDQYEDIKPSKKKMIKQTEQKRLGLETDEQKKMYAKLLDLVIDQVKETELNVKYAIRRINIDPYVSDVTLKLTSLPHLLDPYTEEGDKARTDVYKEQKKLNKDLVDDSNAYYNEIMFKNALIKKGYKGVQATIELDLLFEKDKMSTYDIIGDKIIGDIKGAYAKIVNGFRKEQETLIDLSKLEKLTKLSIDLNKKTLIIGWAPSLTEDETQELRRKRIDQTDFSIFVLDKKKDKKDLLKWLATNPKENDTKTIGDYKLTVGKNASMGSKPLIKFQLKSYATMEQQDYKLPKL